MSYLNRITVVSPVDASTAAVETIDYPHHEIHGGSGYDITGFDDITTNDVIDFRVTTPDTTKWAHMVMEVSTESEYQTYLYETVVIDTVGAAVTPRNHNRNYPDASVLAFDRIDNTSVANADSDTDISGATVLGSETLGSGRGTGGASGSREEWILKQNTIYCVRIVCIGSGWVSWHIDWYEHTNKA